MTVKHTPGPWHIEWSMAQGGEAHHVCDSRDMGDLSTIATVHFHDDTEGETKANARLTAAAPELLVALRDLELGANTVVGCYDRNPGNFAAALADLKRYAARARAAIASVKCDVPETDADADGWVEWNGGECPLPGETLVGVRFECGDVNQCAEAGQWDWAHGDATGYDIVAYRVVQGGAS